MVIDLSFSLIFMFGDPLKGILLLENDECGALNSGIIAGIPDRVQCEYLKLY
jgi:hypothetical protein